MPYHSLMTSNGTNASRLLTRILLVGIGACGTTSAGPVGTGATGDQQAGGASVGAAGSVGTGGVTLGSGGATANGGGASGSGGATAGDGGATANGGALGGASDATGGGGSTGLGGAAGQPASGGHSGDGGSVGAGGAMGQGAVGGSGGTASYYCGIAPASGLQEWWAHVCYDPATIGKGGNSGSAGIGGGAGGGGVSSGGSSGAGSGGAPCLSWSKGGSDPSVMKTTGWGNGTFVPGSDVATLQPDGQCCWDGCVFPVGRPLGVGGFVRVAPLVRAGAWAGEA